MTIQEFETMISQWKPISSAPVEPGTPYLIACPPGALTAPDGLCHFLLDDGWGVRLVRASYSSAGTAKGYQLLGFTHWMPAIRSPFQQQCGM